MLLEVEVGREVDVVKEVDEVVWGVEVVIELEVFGVEEVAGVVEIEELAEFDVIKEVEGVRVEETEEKVEVVSLNVEEAVAVEVPELAGLDVWVERAEDEVTMKDVDAL